MREGMSERVLTNDLRTDLTMGKSASAQVPRLDTMALDCILTTLL